MWRLRPNMDLSVREWIKPYGPQPMDPSLYEWKISTEANGFRTDTFTSSKEPGALRVICIGDSRTLGEGLKEHETFAGQLQRKLGKGTEVLNFGADGWSAFQGRMLLEQEALDYQPDIVVACFGINDSDRAWGVSDYERSRKTSRPYTRIQHTLYRSMIFYAGTRVLLKSKGWLFGKTPVMQDYGKGPPRLTPDAYGTELRRIAKLCTDRDILFVSLILPVNGFYPWPKSLGDPPFGAYNEKAILSTDRTGSISVDLRNSALSNTPTPFYIDDMHLSAAGALVVAEHLGEAISKKLTQ
jgi:lysophospholipase L1-like esterase